MGGTPGPHLCAAVHAHPGAAQRGAACRRGEAGSVHRPSETRSSSLGEEGAAGSILSTPQGAGSLGPEPSGRGRAAGRSKPPVPPRVEGRALALRCHRRRIKSRLQALGPAVSVP